MKNLLLAILWSASFTAFSQAVQFDISTIKAKKVKSITAIDNFQFGKGAELSNTTKVLEVRDYDTSGSIIRLIRYSQYGETQTEFIYNQSHQLVDTDTISKFYISSIGCGGNPPMMKFVRRKDKNGFIKFEKSIYRYTRISRRIVSRANFFYNEKGLLDRMVYVGDRNKRYTQFIYTYF